jgi:GTP cyclohydrolase II
MALKLTAEEIAARARADLRIGAPVALTSESGGALVLAAETLSDNRLAALRAADPQALDLALTHRRAETLRARAYDGDLARVAIPADADAAWLRATADPSRDLASPLKGPYATRRDGPSDLHSLALLLAKQARLLPAAVVAVWTDAADVRRLAAEAGLTELTASTLLGAAAAVPRVERESDARVPTRFAAAGRCHVFRPADGGEEHYAIEIGRPSRVTPVLARLHSACFTGEPCQGSSSRSPELRSCRAARFQAKPDAVHRLDEVSSHRGQLLSYPPDVTVDGAVRDVVPRAERSLH